MHTHPPGTIAIIGAGPRGASLIERIGAHLSAAARSAPLPAHSSAATPALTIHVIDDAPAGAGRIWRTDQTRELCMNTLAAAVTLFTEPSSTVTGPVIEGPDLYEWCLLTLETAGVGAAAGFVAGAVAGAGDSGTTTGRASGAEVAGVSAAKRAGFAAHPVRDGFVTDFLLELLALRPESHPSRALYGEYLAWFYARSVALLPPSVRVVRHVTRAVSVRAVEATTGADTSTGARTGTSTGTEQITLADGTTITAHAVIAATGWLPRELPAAEARLAGSIAAHPDFTWVRPASPVEQDLSRIAPGSHAIVRGLGMGFFDTMSLLTLGRGGSFEPDSAAPGGLRYLASGNEPILHVTSRRGVPFRAKSRYGALPPRSRATHLRAVDWQAMPHPIDFDAEAWPRIIADATEAFYETLLRTHPEAFAPGYASIPAIHRAISTKLTELLEPATRVRLTRATDTDDDQFSARAGAQAWLLAVVQQFDDAMRPLVPDAANRFDLQSEIQPAGRPFATPSDYDSWVHERVLTDLTAANLGAESPLKAGLWAFSSARSFASRTGSYGTFDAESRDSGFATLLSVGGMVGSGPPAFRTQQLLALMAAGLVRFIGPQAIIEVDSRGITARSPQVAGSSVTAPALIDAWMHSHDAGASADPVTCSLLESGRARPFQVAARTGSSVATGGIDVSPETGQLIDLRGNVVPSVYVVGIPVDETLHDTIISPMPGTDPTMLRETDRVARSALQTVARQLRHDSPQLTRAT